MQITNKLPDGRRVFDLSNPTTIDELVRYLDNELVWREAVSPVEKKGWKGQSLTLFFQRSDHAGPPPVTALFVHDTFCYKDGYVADSDWTRIATILEPYLFVPSEIESYEVFAAGQYRDPLTRADLRLMEKRIGVPASGAPGMVIIFWRLGGKQHELKRPILLEADEAIFQKFLSKPSPEHRAKVRFVVDPGGGVGEIEILEYTSTAIADAAREFVESMDYEPGIFDGRTREWRITRLLTFNENGELLEDTGMKYLNSVVGYLSN